MKRYLLQITVLSVISIFSNNKVAGQKTSPALPKTYPHLVLKIPYSKQIQDKAKTIPSKSKKAIPVKITPDQLKAKSRQANFEAKDFIRDYATSNQAVGPMFMPGLTYLRIGEYRYEPNNARDGGTAPLQDQVLSSFFNETEQTCLVADKDFSNRTRINTAISRDGVAAWQIQPDGSKGFKISTTNTAKKYLAVIRTGAAGTEKISLVADNNNASTTWVVYHGPEEGISFYNPAFNVFLGRKLVGRKIFLLAFSYKDYGNAALRNTVKTSWDIYRPVADAESVCYQASKGHSMRYALSYIIPRPDADADGDGVKSMACGGTDCDDTDARKYPGAVEDCDPEGHDEDCNETTSGMLDADGDGYYAATCFQLVNGIIVSQGADCDDNSAAIFPGVQIFISDTIVEVCGVGQFTVEPGFIAVKQANKTAVIVPKN